ncbi:MAG TPA: M50 family metallopeptidase [Streptosporangiaceae bacterium]|jgi:membrane-associated protease RseP (regulator of RpoE activity)|nr:M50 family metallopeptidase [Streptosporangiaceae bacterium]
MDLIGWVIFVVALLFSVMLHETGHFVMAKKFGMKCTRYFVGFGPTIWSTWRGDTEYGIKALPLGGFVKIIGMHSLDDVDDPEDEPLSFRRQPAWQRIIVLCAGSFMHFVLAFLLIAGLALGIGVENTTQLATISPCVAANVTQLDNGQCTASDAESPAKLAGLRAGDQVTSFDGTPVSTWTQLTNIITAAPAGSHATITVLRDGKTVTLHATLASVSGRKGAYLGIAEVVFATASPWRAVTYSGSSFEQVIAGSAKAVAALPAALPKDFGKNRASTTGGQVSSVVGAADETGQAVAANVGWQYKVSFVLLLIASLNIFVGVFNMLPLLPLDGGHVAVVIWERIRAGFARLRGRPDPGMVDMAKLLPVSFSIFMVIMVFGVVLILADIVNPLNLSGG